MTENLAETNVIKLWQLKGGDEHMYDITDCIHNSIVQLTTDIANTCELEDGEKKFIYEITEGTVNKKHQNTKK